jgi:predicted acyl esterase
VCDIKVIVNQYGRLGRAARKWGPDTIEGNLAEDELRANCHDQNVDNVKNHFLDDEYYATKDYEMSDIKVPLLSVGNWGGILLHLRGNVEGFMNAGSEHKYLRIITGRHDLPFYSKEEVELQRSFLDAFLKDNDTVGWSRGKPPKVGYKVRVGDVGYNDAAAEKAYPERYSTAWPIPETKYTKFYLTSTHGLSDSSPSSKKEQKLSYKALGNLKDPQLVQFTSEPFTKDTEFTGHIVAHLNVSVSAEDDSTTSPSDLDLFITVRHLDKNGKEIFYTGTVGDPVPVSKGWLRVSLRKVNDKSPRHSFWHPHREYLSTDHAPLSRGEVYPVDVEVWPTNTILQPGDKLVLEISSGDTQGAGLFEHNSKEDRDETTFKGLNHIHFGEKYDNWLLMPVISQGS